MIKTLIVGLGWWGKVLVNSVQNKSEKIRMVYGLTGTSSDDAKRYAKEKGFELLECSYKEAVARKDIDAVILATPHSLHCEQIKTAAAYGKHVACEKPLALNKQEALTSVKSAQENGVTLSVLYNRRFNPVIQEIHRLILTNALGTICHVESNFSGDSGLRGNQSEGSWRLDPVECPLGSMTSRGLHTLDAIVSFCGEVDTVFTHSVTRALKNREDTTSCLLGFKSGVTGYMATMNATTPFWWLKVFGTEATVEMRDYNKLVFWKRGENPEERLFDEVDLERAVLEAFCDGINGIKSYPVTTEEMINVSAFLEAAVKSKETGNVVKL